MLRQIHGAVVFNRRVRRLASLIAEILPPGARVLDVGCGDGSLDRLIMEQRPDLEITGVDVLLRPETKIPVIAFDGRKLPFEDDTFDVVMFVDVLHHTTHPERLLDEAGRVARHGVVLKDHLRDGLLAGSTLRFMDWVGNAPHGVVLPYNYWPRARWDAAFEANGWRRASWRSDLNLYPWPASLLFDRKLHFVARFDLPSEQRAQTSNRMAAK